jgi:putative transposase
VRRWSVKFGLGIARRIRATALDRGDKWHLDEVVVTINGTKHWLWRAVDQHGAVLDVLVQSRRDKHAARLLMRKLLRKHGRAPRVLITDKLKSYAAANRELGLNVDHRQRKGDPARNSRTPISCSECMYLDSPETGKPTMYECVLDYKNLQSTRRYPVVPVREYRSVADRCIPPSMF